MDPNIILMVIMKYLMRVRDEPMRYAEITMKKVIAMYYLYLRYKKLQEGKRDRKMCVLTSLFSTLIVHTNSGFRLSAEGAVPWAQRTAYRRTA